MVDVPCPNPQCALLLQPSDGVFRKRASFYCCACVGDGEEWREPVPCDACCRPIRTYLRYKAPTANFCGRKCQNRRINLGQLRRRHWVKRQSERSCEVCGNAFTPKRRTAMYCSGRCKQQAHRGRHMIVTSKPERFCPACAEVISSERPRAVYCSALCRQKAFRRRRAPQLRGSAGTAKSGIFMNEEA